MRDVYRQSNHPPSIIRSIPGAINTRLCNISSDKNALDSAIPPYQEALKPSGFDYKLNYKLNSQNMNAREPEMSHGSNRPATPASTNIDSKLLGLVDNFFPPGHPLRQICNRNTLKLIIAIPISSNNKRLLADPNTAIEEKCNCRKKETCSLLGNCLIKGVVFQATIKRDKNQDELTYVGTTEGAFKTRYNNHTNSFPNPKNKIARHLASTFGN